MYRVYINQAGDFRAVEIGTDPESADIATSFECPHWHQFQQELHRRLHDGLQAGFRDEAPDKERRKSGANLL